MYTRPFDMSCTYANIKAVHILSDFCPGIFYMLCKPKASKQGAQKRPLSGIVI